jgi:spoIIIJ-associated protein
MTDARIQVEGETLDAAIATAEKTLGITSLLQLEYELDRDHFRKGADTVKIHAWKRQGEHLEAVGFAVEFVSGFLDRFGAPRAQFRFIEEQDKTILSFSAGDAGSLIIGRDGKNLDALQHVLTKSMIRRGIDYKVVLDVEEYRLRREDRIRAQAREACLRVLDDRRSLTMEPMNSYERRIVHLEVLKHEELKSRSVGHGKLKKLEIAPA